MRSYTVGRVTPAAAPLAFTGERGERVEVRVLSDTVMRVSVYPDGAPRLARTWTVGAHGRFPRAGLPRRDVPALPADGHAFAIEQADDRVVLTTAALRATIDLAALQIEWATRDGAPFAADLPRRAYTYDRGGRAVWHYLCQRPDEHYYGFGETAGPLDKRGQRITLRPLDALGYNAETGDPLYKHFPFYISEIPALGLAYGLFYDNLALSAFDLGREIDAFWGDYRVYTAADGDLEYYLIYGPTIPAVLDQFTALTGRPAVPPRWALGYLGSTMHYTDASDAQAQLGKFVALCQQHDIPCTMFHLSSGYSTDAAGRRNIFTWNRAKVPDPAGLSATFHNAGIRLAANVKPHLLTTHPRYAELAALGGFLRDPDTGQPALAMMWSAGSGESAYGSYIDFTSEAGYAWWKARITDQLLAYGIDAIWNDNNEFELWDDEAVCAGFGEPFRLGLGRPLQTLLMARASYEAIAEFGGEEPPFVLTRSACPGVQRYAQSWSGDNATSWHTLAWNTPMGVGMALSGFPSYGHDVGGFAGPAPSPELFVRWVEHGVFHPRFTIHSWNSDGTVNEPWMYPDALPLIRRLIRLRERLAPYLYALLEAAQASGEPVLVPTWLATGDAAARGQHFDFMLGPALLVAPVVTPGATARRVYLPAGACWRALWSGAWFAGGQTVEVDAPLGAPPVFARSPAGDLPTPGTPSPFEQRWGVQFHEGAP